VKISFFSADIQNTLLGKVALREWIHRSVHNEGLHLVDINIIQCSNDYLLKINKQFLNHDYFTDVITFPYGQDENGVSGEIYISVEQAQIQAENYCHHLQKELQLLVIHGVMHLCGYSDKTPKQKKIMRQKELQYMNTRPMKLLAVSRETHGK